MRPHTVQARTLVKVVLELVAQPCLFGAGSDRLSALPTHPCHTDVVAAFRFADACARAVAEFFTRYDYLLTPTSACVAWPVEQVYPNVIENKEVGPRGHAVFTPLFNLALTPGISVPCGTGRDGLPVGLQIVAPRLHDRPLLAMAQRAETALAR